MFNKLTTTFILTLGLMVSHFSPANEFDNIEISTIPVSEHIVMLQGKGGNIGVLYGEQGVFLIDDQFAPLTPKIEAAIKKLHPQAVRFVINTHWHFDHVGGNENLGKQGSVIVAHENVRQRLSSEQFIAFFKKKMPAAPNVALPMITFSQDMQFHLNGEDIQISHVGHAHTDGDAIVHFKNANVLHTGDIYFAGMYPFIDGSSAGSVDGVINGVKHILGLIDAKTKVIPGHGALSNQAELASYLSMLTRLRDKFTAAIQAGKSADDLVAEKITADYDEKWGKGFLNPESFTRLMHSLLAVTP